MTRILRFSSAALGMVLLAGLAYYQGGMDPTLGQEEILAGTVLAESSELQNVDCESSENLNEAQAEYCAANNPQ